jgi:hypothetical protein
MPLSQEVIRMDQQKHRSEHAHDWFWICIPAAIAVWILL